MNQIATLGKLMGYSDLPNPKLRSVTGQPPVSASSVPPVFKTFFKERAWLLWFEHLRWLEKMGFQHSYKKMNPDLMKGMDVDHNHRIVGLLKEFIYDTGFCNTHWGLTSSDVEDNIHLAWLSQHKSLIEMKLLPNLIEILRQKKGPEFVMARTHGVKAEPKNFQDTMLSYIAAINHCVHTAPRNLRAKALGGPVGNLKSDMMELGLRYDMLDFRWEQLGLRAPVNYNPIQSTDYIQETLALSWFVTVSTQVYKIANDMRLRIMNGDATIKRPINSAGSSSMAHKHNPIIFERACSRCRSIQHQIGIVFDSASHNWLERSLDSSWGLRRVYSQIPIELGNAIEDLYIGLNQIKFEKKGVKVVVYNEDSDYKKLLKLGIQGRNRWEEYVKQLKQSEEKN